MRGEPVMVQTCRSSLLGTESVYPYDSRLGHDNALVSRNPFASVNFIIRSTAQPGPVHCVHKVMDLQFKYLSGLQQLILLRP